MCAILYKLEKPLRNAGKAAEMRLQEVTEVRWYNFSRKYAARAISRAKKCTPFGRISHCRD